LRVRTVSGLARLVREQKSLCRLRILGYFGLVGKKTHQCSDREALGGGVEGVLRDKTYRGTSLIRNRHPVGPYSRTMPRLIWWCWGGVEVSYERGTPVLPKPETRNLNQGACATGVPRS